MAVAQHGTQRVVLNALVLVAALLPIGAFYFVTPDFGTGAAAMLALPLALPLIVAVRLRRRAPAVRPWEAAFVAILISFTAGGAGYVVRDWDEKGFDTRHAEDMRWAEFERRFQQDTAFSDIQAHETRRKNIHWISGTVETEADLERLYSLAAECGIIDRKSDDGSFIKHVGVVDGWPER